jgi:hypothetical protein
MYEYYFASGQSGSLAAESRYFSFFPADDGMDGNTRHVEAAVWDALWQAGRFDPLSNRDDRRKAFATKDDDMFGVD